MGQKQSTWRKTCPSTTLSTTNHTWAGLRLNSGLHDERLVTNCLSMIQLSTCHNLFNTFFLYIMCWFDLILSIIICITYLPSCTIISTCVWYL
jgi:hypothetical protein